MITTKVVAWIDIEAPREEVFKTIANCHRRLQLSPLWGMVKIEAITPEFPVPGSSYQVKNIHNEEQVFETVVTECLPPRQLCYKTLVERHTTVRWIMQEIPKGARVVYEEEFLVEEEERDEMTQQVREMVYKWLNNIKRYSELREGRINRFLKWVLDKYFLKLRQEQRNVILTFLFMHIVGAVSFVLSAIALGIAGVF